MDKDTESSLWISLFNHGAKISENNYEKDAGFIYSPYISYDFKTEIVMVDSISYNLNKGIENV